MLEGLTPEQIQIEEVFFPYNFKKRADAFEAKSRFVHYTSAATAHSILSNQSIWMRNASVMNDFSEIEHGMSCLRFSWHEHEAGRKIQLILENRFPGICQDLTNRFDNWLPDMRSNTFLLCLSEHLNAEDDNGRLSMWRAYGGSTGIALVLNATPFFSTSDELKAYSSPVFYADKDKFADQLMIIANNMSSATDLIGRFEYEPLISLFFLMFKSACLCTKHPGFAEEREWRVFYSPAFEKSPIIEKLVCTVGGIPQIVHRIPLMNSPEHGLVGAAIPDLLERIIIGPAENILPMFHAFSELLVGAGIENPSARIRISGIPLRHRN